VEIVYHVGSNRVLKILGEPSSINVRKVLWTCAELELPYQLEPWATPELPASAPEFLRLNPNGLVPVLVDHGEVLWESNTICRYLAGRYPGEHQRLLPQSAMARAQVEKWMDWQATELNTAWRYAFMALVRNSAAHADPTAIAASAREWNRLMVARPAQVARVQPRLAA
jgi:glutathione S-transferase